MAFNGNLLKKNKYLFPFCKLNFFFGRPNDEIFCLDEVFYPRRNTFGYL